MNKKDIVIDWYIPAEILLLRRWLIFTIGVNLFVLSGEILRENTVGLQQVMVGILLLVGMRWFLPDGIHDWKRWVFPILSLAVGILSMMSFFQSKLSVYDIWSHSWQLLPSILSIIWVFNHHVGIWSKGSLGEIDAQLGLRRNIRLLKKYEALGTHLFLLHAICFIIIPLLWILDIAFSPGNALGGAMGASFSMEHFSYIVNNDAFLSWSINSLIVSVGTVITSLIFAVPAGYAFSRYNFRGRKQSMQLIMLIQMFPGAIILVPYFMVMKTLGLLNSSIGLIIIYSVSVLPISVWMLKGYFDTIPRELEEAAMLDGCSQLQIFYRIILPLSVTAISITALIGFLAAWNEFLLALVFNTSNEMFTLPIGLASLIPATGQRWGDFAAASILVSLPVIGLFVYFQKSLIAGLSSGAVKG